MAIGSRATAVALLVLTVGQIASADHPPAGELLRPKEGDELEQFCPLRLSDPRLQGYVEKMKGHALGQTACDHSELACLVCECEDWSFETGEDGEVSCEFKGQPKGGEVRKKELPKEEVVSNPDEGTIVGKILGFWDVNPDTRKYSFVSAQSFHAQSGGGEVKLGFDGSDLDDNEIALIAKVERDVSVEAGDPDGANVEAGYTAEAGARTGFSSTEGVTRTYIELGAGFTADATAQIGD